MSEALAIIMRRLVDSSGGEPLTGVRAADQFRPEEVTPAAVARNLNAAFLLSLCDESHPLHAPARSYLERAAGEHSANHVAQFLYDLVRQVSQEFARVPDAEFHRAVVETTAWCHDSKSAVWNRTSQERIWSVFFPEGVAGLCDPDGVVSRLRAHRRIRVTRLNPEPVSHPGRQLLLTANVLVTLPHDPAAIARLPYSESLRARLRAVAAEKQRYFYDHPIHIDVEPQANEVLYGLRGLNDAVAFEKERGNADPSDRLTCLLSVSVTHAGLHAIVRDYLRETLAVAPPTPHLEVYAFSEDDVTTLIERVLAPAARALRGKDVNVDALRQVLGVDGEYGRHYSFLKAIAALWQVVMNPEVKATFKIDLDQVFPQRELVNQGGGSAFEHFRSPLWGAEGVDDAERPVTLGMLAGALVNEKDIRHGLFTPDVPRPASIPAGEAAVFFNRLPMALSSEAEMMTRYDCGDLDGAGACLHRYHVTGGTNGILIAALRRYRPFTPTFIGRAEDQAYLLSVLFAGERHLRYVHGSGLIMRHDKEAFAGAAIEAAKSGRFVADLVRTLYFSGYARSLPWPVEAIKEQIDPFTGCFVSRLPVTVVTLRLALAAAERFAAGSVAAHTEAVEMLTLGADRLGPIIQRLQAEPDWLARRFREEQCGWNLYYDVIDWLEAAGPAAAVAAKLRGEARAIITPCRVR